jgi:hypothetical protein
MKRRIGLLLVGLLVLGACAGESGAADTTVAASADGGSAGETPDAAADDGAQRSLTVDFAAVEGRRIIRSASLELRSSDTRRSYDRIVALVNASGGFVADATVHPVSGEEEQPDITLTVRVPADELTDAMTAIKDAADEVVSESQSAEDVTEQYVDLEARLANLEALEVELRALLAEVREQPNADPQKLLTVFNEVSGVRGQIEQIQGQLNLLSDLTDLATLNIGITQTPSSAPIVDQPWSPGEAARDALRSLVNGLQDIADLAIGFTLYTLPLLLLIGGPLAVIAVIIYRRFIRKPAVTQTPG